MTANVTQKKLEESLETYSGLLEVYPDNEDYLQRYADMLQSMGREATAIITLQHLHDVIAQRSTKEAQSFAKKHPRIGRVSLEEIFNIQDKHVIAGKIIFELLGKIWLKIHQKKLVEGQAVCHVGDASDSVILVLKGSVDIYAHDGRDNRVLLENVGIYDVFGEQTFFTPRNINIDAFVSSESALIVRVPRKKLQNMIAANEHLRKMLAQRATFRNVVQTIALHPIFRTLPLKLCKYLARYVSHLPFPEKSMILTLNSSVDGIHLLLTGKACYLAKDKNGKKMALTPIKSQALFGDLLLKGNQAAPSNELFAASQVSTLFMPHEQLLNISSAFPPLMERLVQHAEIQQQQIALSLSKHYGR